jgi:TPR repeat protein
MHLRGEGTKVDFATAFAWLYLAAENGVNDARPMLDRIKGRLQSEDIRIIEDLRARFGRTALFKTLLLTPEELAYSDRDATEDAQGAQAAVSTAHFKASDNHDTPPGRCRPEAYNLNIKRGATRNGGFGEYIAGLGIVGVFADVAADGAVRDMESVLMYPSGPFMREQYQCFQTRGFAPADHAAAPMRTVKMWNMSVAGDRESTEGALRRLGTRLLPCAADGSPSCQEMVALLPFSDAERGSNEHDMLLRAAQGGLGSSQYLYGRYLLAFRGKPAHTKARAWLDIALRSGYQRAGVALARLAITDNSAPDWQEAKRLLQQARSKSDLQAVVPLAAILAAAPDAAVRSREDALDLLEQARRLRGSSDPTTLELAAATDASNGSFDSAVKTQDEAIKSARKLGWATALLEQRREFYAAGRPWYGDLLAF